MNTFTDKTNIISYDESSIGAKAANLNQLEKWRFPVPSFSIIDAGVVKRHLDSSIRSKPPRERAEHIRSIVPDNELETTIVEIKDSLLSGDRLVAVRSSSAGEDSIEHSFAGQLDSFLYVNEETLLDAIRGVWASAYSPRAVAYRERSGLAVDDVDVAVIIQEMIDAEISGVAFGIDPVTGNRRAVVISAVYGLGEGLVSGELDADRYVVDYAGEITTDKQIATKKSAHFFDSATGHGTISTKIESQKQNMACLNDDQIMHIANVTRAISKQYGRAQDIEWAIEAGKLYILQSRPVTTVAAVTDKSDIKRVWDNSNIVESYGGVTTPLTFSFVQSIYTSVYKHFCTIMGVEQSVIDQNPGIFRMLGLIKGRIYYNLHNWYNVLSLLPGYSVNARFMEQMMGVTERLSIVPGTVYSQRNRYLNIVRMAFRLLYNLAFLKKQVKRFEKILNNTLAPYEKEGFGVRTPQELVNCYRELERSLLPQWQAPLINDFFAMIFYGILKNLVVKWKVDSDGSLQNDLLCGEGGIISTEPLRNIQALANQALERESIRVLFDSGDDQDVLRRLGMNGSDKEVAPEITQFACELRNHLAKYGDRCCNELKLETITPRYDPSILIRLVRSYVERGLIDTAKLRNREIEIRASAQKQVQKRLAFHPFRKLLFTYVLKMTRLLIRNRENLRFGRTRLFSVIRELFRTMGRRLYAEGIIEDPSHIFYLTREEIFDYTEGAAVEIDLRKTIKVRIEEFEGYEETDVADRFETYGMVYHVNDFSPVVEQMDGDADLSGTGCCAGVVNGRVKIVHDPNNPGDLQGCILVAKRTDPGWAPLFPLVKGMIIERGSLLSHSAIVAREMGIPAIVGVQDCIEQLQDGEEVCIDGGAGTIVRLTAQNGDHNECADTN